MFTTTIACIVGIILIAGTALYFLFREPPKRPNGSLQPAPVSTYEVATLAPAPKSSWILGRVGIWLFVIAGICGALAIVGVWPRMINNKPVSTIEVECAEGFLEAPRGETVLSLSPMPSTGACWSKVFWKPLNAKRFAPYPLDGPVDIELRLRDGRCLLCEDQNPVTHYSCYATDKNGGGVVAEGFRLRNKKAGRKIEVRLFVE